MDATYGIGLYAAAGFVTSEGALERAVARLSALGHRVVVDPTCTTRWQRFSATDDERLAAVARMAGDPRVSVAMAARGGYGWSRLLDRLDFAALAATRKRWLGHSDFTAFQLAALAHAGMTTFAGPMAAADFGAATPSAFTLDHCWGLLGSDRYEVECALDGPDFEGEGTLWGGNLAMVAHLVGTPHLPRVEHGILFLEDIAEHPYRVERMLHQLHFAGILARQRAVLLGTFNGYELAPERQRLRRRGDGRALPRDARRASLHRTAVRPRPRKADAARRRTLRADGDERPSAARLSATTALRLGSQRSATAKRTLDLAGGVSGRVETALDRVAHCPRRSIVRTVEQRVP